MHDSNTTFDSVRAYGAIFKIHVDQNTALSTLPSLSHFSTLFSLEQRLTNVYN
jgi:hypothetical protein